MLKKTSMFGIMLCRLTFCSVSFHAHGAAGFGKDELTVRLSSQDFNVVSVACFDDYCAGC